MSTCPLTGKTVDMFQPGGTMEFHYETPLTGKVIFTDIALMSAPNLSDEEKQILAGICRNKNIKGEGPTIITSALLSKLKEQEIPYGFEERARHLLEYLYDNGGKEYKEHNFNSKDDSLITYSLPDEFNRIINYLKSEDWLDYRKVTPTFTCTFYQGVHLTKNGIEEIEKGLPKMPLFDLVNQKISTGDAATDATIEHARRLFFDKHSTLESKRSACETLSYVLEPLRDELKNLFSGDTEQFFNIVNNFNIRHNKERTRQIQHQEQLEWIFYSLLNTINTYVKMKTKLG